MEPKCAACLSTDSLINWNEILQEDDEVSYADVFFHVTNFDKSTFDKLEWLCSDCSLEIRDIFKFIQKAVATELKLEIAKNPKQNDQYCCNDGIKVEKLSIEIEPLSDKEDEEQPEIKTNTKVGNESELDCVQDDLGLKLEEDRSQSIEENHESESETETYSQISDEIKFELVDVDKDVDDESMPEGKEGNSNRRKMQRKRSAENDSPTKSFVCEYCGKEYKSESTRKRHIISAHTEEKLLCDVCPRTFKDPWSLKKHKKTHDANRTRDYPCLQCGLNFLTAHSLKGHMEIHDENREKRFPCDQCDKAFFHKGALNVHKRIHTGNLRRCEICNKRYPREVDLEIHMRSHTGEKPFQCSNCDKAFKFSSTLYNHVRKAHFGYSYKCSYCSKQYKDKASLVEHMKVHKNCQFKCALCDKEMVKKYQLKCHLRTVHSVESATDVEQLIISGKDEAKHRLMRKFTDVEYKAYIKVPDPYSRAKPL